MRLDEEARDIEAKMLHRAHRISEPRTLKLILQQALTEFENAVKSLPANQKEEALASYLEEIRRTTFSFHMAVFRRSTRALYATIDNPAGKKCCLQFLEQGMQKLTQLYRFI